MKKLYFLVIAILMVTLSFGQTEVFINEIHYDNDGTDSNEGFEISGPSGTDLSNYTIVLYNGTNGQQYNSINLSGILTDDSDGYGFKWFGLSVDGLQNGSSDGSPDGIALVNTSTSTVVQFLSYEGSFTATDGAASGITSTDIGVEESGTTPVGYSLQLVGSGVLYEDFTWVVPSAHTNGTVNTGQTFSTNPFIFLNTNAVTDLNYMFNHGPSTVANFTVFGTYLSDDIVLTASTNYEISETSVGGWTSSITLTKGGGTTIATTTIFVRLKTGLSIGSYSEDITLISAGAVTKTVTLSGHIEQVSMLITGVYDGPLPGGTPKGVELYVINDIPDLSIYGLGTANNGEGTDGEEFTFPAISASVGDYIYLASETTGFSAFFDFTPDYTSLDLGVSGDDAIELFGFGSVIDVFGDVSYTALVPTSWEYTDGWAYRNTPGPNTVFSVGDWNYSGVGALDEATTNATAATPFPIATYNMSVLSVVKDQIEGFIMYPNPVTNGMLYMSSKSSLNKQVTIFALTGQQVYSKNLQAKEHIDISSLNKGIYLVRIIEEDKIATRKLVVN
ncbi:T9SS type A sorting domain-containing protein [Lutibacter sp. A80]|uniref:T9SS type A sorting domain-containing protein n=1 Tax=Lutibacter sp. A80 TaxID=2918453 RepID=UPI001F059D2C|nr:T9SS type A sorting domain-containing protein [Lutibacter sp. A80]UMB59368.1 T9SS type A sorting domain-containing protein [Lutibacter sp. A80]